MLNVVECECEIEIKIIIGESGKWKCFRPKCEVEVEGAYTCKVQSAEWKWDYEIGIGSGLGCRYSMSSAA